MSSDLNDRGQGAGETGAGGEPKPLLKLLIELGPLVVFFLVNARLGIFWATGIFMVAIVISLIASRIYLGKLPVMPLVTGVMVLVFGALTLYLQDETFIKMKPTIVNVLFASVVLGSLATGGLIGKTLLGDSIAMDDDGWRKLHFRWGLFFVFLALLNEIVWRNFSTDTWVSFKVFGIMPISMIFFLWLIYSLKGHLLHDETSS